MIAFTGPPEAQDWQVTGDAEAETLTVTCNGQTFARFKLSPAHWAHLAVVGRQVVKREAKRRAGP